MARRIFVMNPGSSSMKVALYEDLKPVFTESIRLDAGKLRQYKRVYDQIEFRYSLILELAEKMGLDFGTLDAIACRGGFCKPVIAGTYEINEAMLADLRDARWGEHASNVGPFIADRLAKEYGIHAYITNPVSVDEFMPESYVTGMPEVRRVSKFHALNHKAVARRVALQLGRNYEDCNFIVAHMGGGISIAAHQKGLVIDCSNPAEEGPMSIDRAGTMPVLQFTDYVYKSGLSRDEMILKVSTGGGLMRYIGETDLIKIEEMAQSDPQVKLLLDTLSYRIAFWISGFAATLKGQVDAVILTGGMARSDVIVPAVRERVSFIAPVVLVPGEFEMDALAEGTFGVLAGTEENKVY